MTTKAKTKYRASHLSRVCVLALHTFTQLSRMKAFYFLAIFALIMLLSNFFDLPQFNLPENSGLAALTQIKSWSLGVMQMFATVLGIVATALILPKDIEDRTLYTILAKPVPRIDYLCGKLLGVLALLAASLLLMDILMAAVLQGRTWALIAKQEAYAATLAKPQEYMAVIRETLKTQSGGWELQAAVLAAFLRAAVISALALFISTFATSTLFTAITSFLLYFIGHFQADMRDFYLQTTPTGAGMAGKIVAILPTLILPDFQLFNIIDAAIQGQAIELAVLGKVVLAGTYYVVFYTLAAWYVFSDKEC